MKLENKLKKLAALTDVTVSDCLRFYTQKIEEILPTLDACVESLNIVMNDIANHENMYNTNLQWDTDELYNVRKKLKEIKKML